MNQIWIKDQKNNLFLINNVTSDSDNEVCSVLDFENNGSLTLGIYETKERCDEVIEEIFESIKSGNFYYEMPEK